MNRNFSSEAVILSLSPLGENNSLVTMLTKERGIYKACLYGGPKSKLRSLCTPFNYGTIFIYENTEKKQNKISDFDVKNFHMSFSQNLFKTYAANLACEIAIKTECGGDNRLFWPLIISFLDGMELSTEMQSRAGLLRFLWRFIKNSGLMPQLENCSSCENTVSKNQLSYYNVNENSFMCSDCAEGHGSQHLLPVKYQGLMYLWACANLDPQKARNYPLDEEAFNQIRVIIYEMTKLTCSARLNTLEIGMGIL